MSTVITPPAAVTEADARALACEDEYRAARAERDDLQCQMDALYDLLGEAGERESTAGLAMDEARVRAGLAREEAGIKITADGDVMAGSTP